MSPISGATRLLGVIADPVAQARSPGMANALLERRGRLGDFVLVPMHVAAGALEPAIAGLRALGNFAGAIVSMPHKSAITALVDEQSDAAREVGAANVIRREADGRLVATMLDGEGFVAGLRAAGHEVAGKRCLLVGAGGAASAIAFALARHGCRALAIANRSERRAVELAERVSAAWPRVEVRAVRTASGACDVAINATPLGMRAGDELPLPRDVVAAAGLVAECVIAPEVTPLLELARALGRSTHGGVPMLAAQMDLMLDFMGAG